ncbi:hypothetical protein C8N24_2980 [Solirubrobacter pauli]|uniref:Uncharacterized protein n=1 Tax=Solirubrobacter pauli TaxID=166793 RepID=A0A660LGQ7_9ACTN|nr:hypothetical protein [Solirubrobacter pauli]RKQ93120.1 hypothetical protein C8N24_2980 [Solirubrobacter pauli]
MTTRAQELLAARARRVRAAHQRVIAAVLASFVLAWGAVAWDGSMGAETTASTTRTTTSASQATPEDTWSDQGTSSVPDTGTGADDGSSLSTGQS